jgi:hypothetical protein
MKADASLYWSGEYSDSGCGFLIIARGQEYKPENEFLIHEKYKTAGSVSVYIEYIDLNKTMPFQCQYVSQANEIEMIEIVVMKEM